MIQRFFKTTKYLPFMCAKTIFHIDYNKLYEDGRRIILIDLDNTIIPYDQSEPNKEIKELFQEIKNIGLEVIIMSNNHEERVGRFANLIDCKYVPSTYKPLKTGYRKALKKVTFNNKSEIIAIGDQLMTDVLGASRSHIDCILVTPIKKKTEKWYTKINRKMERDVLKQIKKKYPVMYQELENIGVKI